MECLSSLSLSRTIIIGKKCDKIIRVHITHTHTTIIIVIHKIEYRNKLLSNDDDHHHCLTRSTAIKRRSENIVHQKGFCFFCLLKFLMQTREFLYIRITHEHTETRQEKHIFHCKETCKYVIVDSAGLIFFFIKKL